MARTFEEAAEERKSYVEQVRASFYGNAMEGGKAIGARQYGEQQEDVLEGKNSSFGIRLLLAILLFAGFVYCDQENITFQGYGAKDIVQQIEWNPLPIDDVVELVTAEP